MRRETRLRAGGEAAELRAASCGFTSASQTAGVSGIGIEIVRLHGGDGFLFGGYAGRAPADEKYFGEDSGAEAGNYFAGNALRHEAAGEFCRRGRRGVVHGRDAGNCAIALRAETAGEVSGVDRVFRRGRGG